MNTLAFQSVQTLAEVTMALRGGASAEVAFRALSSQALRQTDSPLFPVYLGLTLSAAGDVTTSRLSEALLSVIPTLERLVPGDTDSAFALRQAAADLEELKARSAMIGPLGLIPSVFQPSAATIVGELSNAVSHQILNPLAIADMNLQMIEAAMGRDAQGSEKVRQAREALRRASQFVQGLSMLVGPSLDQRHENEELLTRVERLFQWEPAALPEPLPFSKPTDDVLTIDPLASHILYIEDESDLGELMMMILGQMGFTGIRWVDNAEAALEVFDQERFSLVVSDFRLPGTIDGVEIARRIRQKNSGIPFIFLTASPTEVCERLTPNEKVDFRVLNKPVDSDKLADEILAAIGDKAD
jgi:CheY-like chemotaxis protein